MFSYEREEADLTALGATVVHGDPNIITAWLPQERLKDAVLLPWVLSVRPPARGFND